MENFLLETQNSLLYLISYSHPPLNLGFPDLTELEYSNELYTDSVAVTHSYLSQSLLGVGVKYCTLLSLFSCYLEF